MANPRIYHQLAELAKPYNTEEGPLFDFRRSWWQSQGALRANTPPLRLTTYILSGLTILNDDVLSRVLAEEVIPEWLAHPEPVEHRKVPSDALVRVAFRELDSAIDERFGNLHDNVVKAAVHLGIFTVSFALGQIEGEVADVC